MLKRTGIFAQWVFVIGLVGLLAMGGCSKKNVGSRTTGAESQESAKSKMAGVPKGGERGGERAGESPGLLRSEAERGEIPPAPGDTRSGAGGDTGLTGTSPTEKGGKAETGLRSEPIGKSGMEPGTGGTGGTAGRSTESLGPIGSGPLQGFSKGPAEERLGDTPPLMIAKAEPQDAETRRTQGEKRQELADIYFAFDKWVLSEEGKKNLADSAKFLKQNPTAKLVIEGYCDERGSREYNLVLGEKRAKETRRYLADLGIENPVSVTSYGKERQVCMERDESCYWRNRRAHLLVDAGK
jgi:peptidoglycan-associated lipoprotein